MLSADAIRQHIVALLQGELLLDQFEDWLVASSWNARQRADANARQLVGAIELRLAEYSSDHLDLADLMAELQALLLYGCQIEPMQSAFISVVDSDATVVSTTFSYGPPDYQFTINRAQTTPITRTGSAKTIVRERVALAP